MKRLAIALTIAGLLVPATVTAAPAATGSITVTTTSPLTLTGTYSHVPQSRQPQFPNQPQVQVWCADFSGVQGTVNASGTGGGSHTATYPFFVTPTGPCSANYGYFFEDSTGVHYVQLDFVTFAV